MTSNAPAHRHSNFFPKERMMKSNHAVRHHRFFIFSQLWSKTTSATRYLLQVLGQGAQ
jgi:hypothetical protein